MTARSDLNPETLRQAKNRIQDVMDTLSPYSNNVAAAPFLRHLEAARAEIIEILDSNRQAVAS
jgi:hypothetical protein